MSRARASSSLSWSRWQAETTTGQVGSIAAIGSPTTFDKLGVGRFRADARRSVVSSPGGVRKASPRFRTTFDPGASRAAVGSTSVRSRRRDEVVEADVSRSICHPGQIGRSAGVNYREREVGRGKASLPCEVDRVTGAAAQPGQRRDGLSAGRWDRRRACVPGTSIHVTERGGDLDSVAKYRVRWSAREQDHVRGRICRSFSNDDRGVPKVGRTISAPVINKSSAALLVEREMPPRRPRPRPHVVATRPVEFPFSTRAADGSRSSVPGGTT